jgi:hypothetical protein
MHSSTRHQEDEVLHAAVYLYSNIYKCYRLPVEQVVGCSQYAFWHISWAVNGFPWATIKEFWYGCPPLNFADRADDLQ